MLDVQALEAWYGQAQVLYGVSLGVGAGECVALVGRNGAGKSTTMKAIMGLMARRRGRVAFRGRDISVLLKGNARQRLPIVEVATRKVPAETVRDELERYWKAHRR